MRTNLANAAHDILGYGSYPIALVLMAPTIPCRLRAPELMSWMIATAVVGAGGETTGRRCVSCIAVSYDVQEGSQS